MTQRSGWSSERTLILAVLAFTVAVAGAVVLLLSGAQGSGAAAMLPYSLALVAAGGVAAWLINHFGRKAARKNRPEWLETQAWHQGLIDKLHQGPPGSGAKPETRNEPGSPKR